MTPPAQQELEKKRGLAQPRLRDKRKKTAIRFNPIEQGGQGLPVPGAEVKVARVRSHSKRLLTQLVEIEEHWFYLSFAGSDAATGLARNDSPSSRGTASVLADSLLWN